MTQFTVHFQHGHVVGARRLRMVHVEAPTVAAAVRAAKREFNGAQAFGFKLTRVDHFDEETDRLVIDR